MQGVDLSVKEGHRGDPEPSEQKLLLPGDWSTQQMATGGGLIEPVGTHWVERDVLGVAEEVAQRWPNLRVASCDCGCCLSQGHYPHVVVEMCKDGKTRPVFGFTKFGRHIIERLAQIHVSNQSNEQMEKQNEKVREDLKKKTDEKRRADLEVVESALKSHKHDWKGPNGLRTNSYARIV